MTTITITVDGIEEVKRALGDRIEEIQDAASDAIRRSLPEIARECEDAIRRHILATTNIRTGTLLRSVRVNFQRNGQAIVFIPDFPGTMYRTRRARTGQYAYVLNSRRRFIQRGFQEVTRRRIISTIIQRNINQAVRGLL